MNPRPLYLPGQTVVVVAEFHDPYWTDLTGEVGTVIDTQHEHNMEFVNVRLAGGGDVRLDVWDVRLASAS